MPINGGSVNLGATHAPTGGTAATMSVLGSDRSGAKILLNDSAAFSLRSTLNISVVEPTVNANALGGYTAAKRRVARQKPITLASGDIFVNQCIVEMIVHPETSVAQITELRSGACLVANDADFDGLWNSGSLS